MEFLQEPRPSSCEIPFLLLLLVPDFSARNQNLELVSAAHPRGHTVPVLCDMVKK
jgi:hypothetical protein